MKRAIYVILAITCAACATRATSSSIAYRKQVVLSVPVHVVYVDLNDRGVKVTVAMSKRGRGSSETASSIVSRTHPKAAITGTFFDTRSLLPTGDIVIGGVRAHAGCIGPALCITPDNNAEIISHKQRNGSTADYETVLAGGPALVAGGRISLNPRAEGFRDPALYRKTLRTAVGLTSNNKMLLVSVRKAISMHMLAKIMIGLGCDRAMMLDGGSSTTMYANGQFITRPARRLTNLLLAYETSEDFARSAEQLAPTLVKAEQMKTLSTRVAANGDSSMVESWYRRIAGSSEESGPFRTGYPGVYGSRTGRDTWMLSRR